MQRFLQWYNKNTRNKVIIFSVIFILALGYSFLHRPLGLAIFWISTYSGNSYNEMQRLDKIRINMGNKDALLKLSDEYNLPIKVEKHRKELLNYINKFTTDLLIVNLLGLEDWYYQPLLIKAKIYGLEDGCYTSYKVHKGISITQDDIQSTLDFLNIFDTLIYFFDKISSKDVEYKKYMLQAKLMQFIFIQPKIFVLAFSEDKLCSVVDIQARNILLERLEDVNNALLQDFSEIGIDSQLLNKDVITNILDVTAKAKEVLNECK